MTDQEKLTEKCKKCGRSPWVHALKGALLYCDVIGGDRSSFDLETVNLVRATIGKKVFRPV